MLITRLCSPSSGELHMRSTWELSVGSAEISLPAFFRSGDAPLRALVSSRAVCRKGGRPFRMITCRRCSRANCGSVAGDCGGGYASVGMRLPESIVWPEQNDSSV